MSDRYWGLTRIGFRFEPTTPHPRPLPALATLAGEGEGSSLPMSHKDINDQPLLKKNPNSFKLIPMLRD